MEATASLSRTQAHPRPSAISPPRLAKADLSSIPAPISVLLEDAALAAALAAAANAAANAAALAAAALAAALAVANSNNVRGGHHYQC